jgi:hypothetical protein
MLSKILIGTCLTVCVAACATSPSTSGTTKPAAATATVPPAGCVADTATRIAVSPRDCAGFGRVWTDQDVKSTGATSAGQALRQLDPTVTVTGH